MKKLLPIPALVLALTATAQHGADLLSVATAPAATLLAEELPLELVSFVAQTYGDHEVTVRWTTLGGSAHERFQLERSSDLQRWEPITEVPGKPAGPTVVGYEVADDAPLPGVSYYRLMQQRKDRLVELSDLFSVSRPVEQTLYITPGREPGKFSVSAQGDLSDVRMMNNRGQFVPLRLEIGTDQVVVNAELLEPGTYYIQANVNGSPALRPVIITSSSIIGG